MSYDRPRARRVTDYGAVGDCKCGVAGDMTSGSAVLTDPAAAFAEADVGKSIVVGGAGAASAHLVTTILSRQSATQVTLAANAGTTVNDVHYAYGTDDTTAIQAALTAAGILGADTVLVPVRRYLTLGQLTAPAGANLKGEVQGPFDRRKSPGKNLIGPTLVVTTTLDPFLLVDGGGGGITDLIFHYGAQADAQAAAPRTYGWCIDYRRTDPVVYGSIIARVLVTEAYDGIKVSGGRHVLEDVWIGAYHENLMIDQCSDVVRVRGAHLHPMWDYDDSPSFPQPLDDWSRANGTGLVLGGVDMAIVADTFVFGKLYGIKARWMNGSQRPTGYGTLTNCALDQCTIGASFDTVLDGVAWNVMGLYLQGISNVGLHLNSTAAPVPPVVNVVGGVYDGLAPLVEEGTLNITSMYGTADR